MRYISMVMDVQTPCFVKVHRSLAAAQAYSQRAFKRGLPRSESRAVVFDWKSHFGGSCSCLVPGATSTLWVCPVTPLKAGDDS